MTVRQWTVRGLCVTRFCRDAAAPVLYVSGDARGLEDCGWTLVSVENLNWSHDLTPWPAKAAFRGQSDFGGGASEYLKMLTQEIMPAVEADLQPSLRAIAGYSLAGLFAVYASLETKLFDAAASVSGSMWYPGFAEYVCQNGNAPGKTYFSVGDREKSGRNKVFHSIEEDTKRIARALEIRGAETVFELNAGGHFDDPSGRMRRAVDWLNKSMNLGNGG